MCCQGHRWESVRYKPVLKDLAVKDIRVQHFHAMHVQTMFGLLYLNMTFLKRQKKQKKTTCNAHYSYPKRFKCETHTLSF